MPRSPKYAIASLINRKLNGEERRAARRRLRGTSADSPELQAVILQLERMPDIPPEQRWRITETMKAEMRNWRKRGWTLRRIGRMYDVSDSTVAEACGERPATQSKRKSATAPYAPGGEA